MQTKISSDGWHTKNPHLKCCRIPYQVKQKDIEVYKLLLHSHCQHPDKKNNDHQCCGVITISEKSIVLRCKKCGDAKGQF